MSLHVLVLTSIDARPMGVMHHTPTYTPPLPPVRKPLSQVVEVIDDSSASDEEEEEDDDDVHSEYADNVVGWIGAGEQHQQRRA